MKTSVQILFIVLTFSGPLSVWAQGTAFTYQGLLTDGGSPAQGSYDLQFTLYDAQSGGNPVGAVISHPATPVATGRFTVILDYGAGSFTGLERWLEIHVRPAGSLDPFTVLGPRQALHSAPYAIRALEAGAADHAASAGTAASAPWSGLTGVPVGLAFLGADQTWSGANTFSGQIILTSPDSLISATNGHPLEFLVDDLRALRLESAGDSNLDADTLSDGAPNVIAGAPVNRVLGAVGATVSGGGASNLDGAASPNLVSANFATISGGFDNSIESDSTGAVIGGGRQNQIEVWAQQATIGGGEANRIWDSAGMATIAGGDHNTIGLGAQSSTIAGGVENTIESNAIYGAIGGGWDNTIQHDSVVATIAGGDHNTIGSVAQRSSIGGGTENMIQSGADYGVIGGGAENTIQINGAYGTVPGGRLNSASAYGFAAGHRAKANHTGTFVWADSADADFVSTGTDQFLIRAAGGIGINTDDPSGATLVVAGAVRATSFEGAGGPLSLSTTGNQPLELIVNGARSLRLEPSSHDSANVIAGGAGNSVAVGVAGATISGGGAGSYGGFSQPNRVESDFATVSGGRNNVVRGLAHGAAIGGGRNHTIETSNEYATIAGGESNTILGGAHVATIGGGAQNSILSGAEFATIPGGDLNSAATRSFAAGHRAKAIHPGTFVWADSTDTDFASTGNHQFIVRASGGVGINKNNPATALDVGGGVTATSFSGAGSGLTGLNAGQVTAGTLPDTRLSGNVARRDTANTFSVSQEFNAPTNFRSSARLWNNDLYFRTGSTDTNHGLGYYYGTSGTKAFGSASVIDGPVLYGWLGGALGTKAGGVNREVLSWNFNNQVGIGITSPGFNLHVDGSAGKPGGGSWSVASDLRLKKNVRPLTGALDQLLQLHGVRFEYKDPESIHELPGERTGLIAQDVEKVFPDWVEDGADGMKRLTVRGFEALAVEALRQEHDERIAEIARLKQEVADLKQLVRSLLQQPEEEVR